MPVPEGTSERFSNDPALDQSINDVLSEFVEQPDPAAAAPTSQDGRGSVETPSLETPAAPSPGDSGSAPLAAPADPNALPQPEPEPQYEPFTYTVNGEARTIDGSFRIPGEGLFVPEAQVPRWQQLASRAEANETTLRALHEQTQTWEKIATWTVPGPNGQSQTLTGRHAYEAQRVALDQLAAAASVYRSYLQDPNKLASLLSVDPQTQQVFLDPSAKRILDLEVKDTARDAESRVRSWLAQFGQSAPAQPPQAELSPADLTQQVSQQAPQILTGKIAEWGLKGQLTQDDVNTLARQLPRYVRIATREDVQADPSLRVGTPVLENDFEALARQLAAVSARGSQGAQARSVADRFNQGQQRGRASNAPRARPATPTPPPDEPSKRGRNRAPKSNWDQILERGMNDPDVQAALAGG